MKNLDKETIHSLTELCRIHCTEEQEEGLLADLRNILGYIEQLQTLATEGAPPCHHVIEGLVYTAAREDIVEPGLTREEFLANAPRSKAGMIEVPPVIKPAGA